MADNKHAGGRPRKGSLYWTKSGWRARITVDVDSVPVQKSFKLETLDKQVARVKLRRLLKQHPSIEVMKAEARRFETFQEAAERVIDESPNKSKKTSLDRLRLHAFPTLGKKPVDQILAGDIRDLLDGFAKGGASKQSCVHLRQDIGVVLGDLWRTDVLPSNVVGKVQIPKGAKVDKRERTVLEDHELAAYLAWVTPDKRERGAVLERQVMACVARTFGGPRWGDLRAWDWSFFDTSEDGAFTVGWVPREKTERPQAIEVPEMLRPILRRWWVEQKKPTDGPVFPVRRGARAGESRQGGSQARALRRDLVRAFGIHKAEAVTYERSNGRAAILWKWTEARPMTPRERDLLTETKFTRPVDFHSFRRRFKQALAENNVDLQESMRLSGASSAEAHQRYLKNTAKVAIIPAGALPSFSMVDAETPEPGNDTERFCSGIVGRRDRDRTCDSRCVKPELYR